MTLARVFDAKAVNLQRTGQLGTYASSLGHEATHVGVGAAMQPEDVLAPVYREFGTQLWRGVTMTRDPAVLGRRRARQRFRRCRATTSPGACPSPPRPCMRPARPWLSSCASEPRCAVAYIGDGGTSEGAFYEALNLAGARALPVVFVIVNNGWAISVPVAQQTAAQTLAQKAMAAGIPGIQVDGNDVFAVRASSARRSHARAARRRPDADRGAHLSLERPHHRRRCQPLPRAPRRSSRRGRSSPCSACAPI